MKIKNIQTSAFLQNLTKAYQGNVYQDNALNRKLGRVGQPYLSYPKGQQKEDIKEEYNKEKKNKVDKLIPTINSIDDLSFNKEGKCILADGTVIEKSGSFYRVRSIKHDYYTSNPSDVIKSVNERALKANKVLKKMDKPFISSIDDIFDSHKEGKERTNSYLIKGMRCIDYGNGIFAIDGRGIGYSTYDKSAFLNAVNYLIAERGKGEKAIDNNIIDKEEQKTKELFSKLEKIEGSKEDASKFKSLLKYFKKSSFRGGAVYDLGDNYFISYSNIADHNSGYTLGKQITKDKLVTKHLTPAQLYYFIKDRKDFSNIKQNPFES